MQSLALATSEEPISPDTTAPDKIESPRPFFCSHWLVVAFGLFVRLSKSPVMFE
jgi:hypothetical protein